MIRKEGTMDFNFKIKSFLMTVKDRDEALFNHLSAVANHFKYDSREFTIGYLHDVIEDKYITYEELKDIVGDVFIADCVKLLTRRDDESYLHYINRLISVNDNLHLTACKVKLADLHQNLNVLSLTKFTQYELDRLDKYYHHYINISKFLSYNNCLITK